MIDIPWHELTPAKPRQGGLSRRQNFGDPMGKRQHRCSELLTRSRCGKGSLTSLYHISTLQGVIARGGADILLSPRPARPPHPHGFRGWERAPMKQSEARVRIIEQWDRWILQQSVDPGGPTGKDSLKFFHELQDTRSPLLDFQARGRDKWRIIHAWLLEAERVFDDWISPAPRIVPAGKPQQAARKKPGAKIPGRKGSMSPAR